MLSRAARIGSRRGHHCRNSISFFAKAHNLSTSSSPPCNVNSILSHSLRPSAISSASTLPTSFQSHQLTQIRHLAGRKDRASASFEARQPTKKQRKKYHRRKRALDYEKNKHSPPNSKAVHRRREEKENTERLIEIAKEEEHLKGQLGAYYEKVKELQSKIEGSPKFQTLLEEGKVTPDELKSAARDAAKRAADKSSTPHPPLPSWWQDRLTYDWGDALVDDLMGNSADLTSSISPSPAYMGGEFGRLRRKVERLVRIGKLDEGGDEKGLLSSNAAAAAASEINEQQSTADKLLSDLIRAYRDAHGKRTNPIGLASTLQLLHEMQIPLSKLGTYSSVSLLTCCKNPVEGRNVDQLRKANGIPSNEYYWCALVDVYARSGDYRGAESVLDEMLDESQSEQHEQPIAVPPLPAYTSFLASCHKLISRPDVHPSIKADAGNRAWARWKEMRIHGVPPDVMAYGAMMRVFAAQGRAEKAIDLLEEIMDQMMLPSNAESVLNNTNNGLPKNLVNGVDDDGWYADRDGTTQRIKPTTLLFTSALKAVSKSHEIANKFSGGQSKKNRRRESTTAHHGRLARKVVILAEQAEVRQDDGFVSALMMCAAAAGDSSTARAVYLASKVRQLDHLRTCGGNDHLMRLQGLIPEDERQGLLGEGDGGDGRMPALAEAGGSSNNSPALRSTEDEFTEEHTAYEHREYGTDTRVLSTLLLSHSKAMEPKGLGSMWRGRYNRGYLCPNSLRYIEAYNQPQYENMAIPGLDSVQAGLTPEGWQREEFDDDDYGEGNGKRLRKKHKFNIQQIMDDGEGNRRDDMDSFFDDFDQDPEEMRRKELRLLNGGGDDEEEQEQEQIEAGRDWLNDKLLGDGILDRRKLEIASSENEDGITTASYRPNHDVSKRSSDGEMSSNYGNDFDSDSDDDEDGSDNDEAKVVHGFNSSPRTDREALVQAMAEVTNDLDLAEDLIPQEVDLSPESGSDNEEGEEDDFDFEEFNKLMADTEAGMDDDQGGDAENVFDIPGVATNDFAAFCAHLRQELIDEGSTNDVDEAEARQLFDMMRTFHDEKQSSIMNADANDDVVEGEETMAPEQLSGGTTVSSLASSNTVDSHVDTSAMNDAFFDTPRQNQNEGTATPQRQRSPPPSIDMSSKTIYADDYIEWAKSQNVEVESSSFESNNKLTSFENELSEVDPQTAKTDVASLPRPHTLPLDPQEEDPHIIELQQNLPGLPMNRIKKVSDEFEKTLGYPSILGLTLAVRENMPEAFSPQCLVRKNLANAKHLMAEAEKEGLVDAHLLNGMLRVFTNSGRIEPALRFYNTEYAKHGMTPTTHSDRLLLEMLVNKKRIGRAFKLKQDIEKDGRKLDLLSYGSLIEHYGRQHQLGSAFLLIKECINVHGSAPGEKCLKNIRVICRKRGLTDDLEEMVGKDPLEWLRQGEKNKYVQNKRVKSSAMQFGLNRMLDI